MKKLQNSFTTPEQSKRLLGLGVPASSADCYYRAIGFGSGFDKLPNLCGGAKFLGTIDMPCWSVGRLLEIYDKCRCYDGDWDEVYGKETYIETYISAIEEAVLDEMLDFSRLDE